MRDLNMRNASMGLTNMTDENELRRMQIQAQPQPDNRRQNYLDRVAGNALPQRDMRGDTYQSNVTGEQVPNYAKQYKDNTRQSSLQNNQLQHRTNNANQLTRYDEQPDYSSRVQSKMVKPTAQSKTEPEYNNGFF